MSWLRKASLACLALYWSALFMGTHIPGNAMPNIPASDKLQHWIAFVGLTFLISAALSGRRATAGRVLLSIFIAATYAAFDELTQSLVPMRTSDIRDWGADVFGAAVGAGAFVAAYGVLCWIGWIRTAEPVAAGSSRRANWYPDPVNESA